MLPRTHRRKPWHCRFFLVWSGLNLLSPPRLSSIFNFAGMRFILGLLVHVASLSVHLSWLELSLIFLLVIQAVAHLSHAANEPDQLRLAFVPNGKCFHSLLLASLVDTKNLRTFSCQLRCPERLAHRTSLCIDFQVWRCRGRLPLHCPMSQRYVSRIARSLHHRCDMHIDVSRWRMVYHQLIFPPPQLASLILMALLPSMTLFSPIWSQNKSTTIKSCQTHNPTRQTFSTSPQH